MSAEEYSRQFSRVAAPIPYRSVETKENRLPEPESKEKTAPADAEELFARAEKDAQRRMTFYKNLGEMMK